MNVPSSDVFLERFPRTEAAMVNGYLVVVLLYSLDVRRESVGWEGAMALYCNLRDEV